MSAHDGPPNGSTNEPLDQTTNLPLHMTLAAFTGIAWYNVIELNISVYMTFKRRRGLYFWSILACIQGIACHSVAIVLKLYGVVEVYQVTVTMITIGWYLMVTGQALVLYSRLHLLVGDPRIVKAVLVMILFNAVTMHLPTTVLTYGSNSPQHESFTHGFKIMEKLQMTMFSLQEFVISGIYIWATLRFLRPVYRRHVRSVMVRLLWINVAIIVMDLAMLAMEYAGFYLVEAVMKGAIYSVKLKLEFVVLNQLMQIAGSSHEQSDVVAGEDKGGQNSDGGGGGGGSGGGRGRGTAALSPAGFKGWLRHLLPGPPPILSSAHGGDADSGGETGARTYYIHPSVLQSTFSTRHHQQERNVSSQYPNTDADGENMASHGIAMKTEIRQEFCTAAELDELRERAKRRCDPRTIFQGAPASASALATSYYGETMTTMPAGRENSLDGDGVASDQMGASKLELAYLPPSSSSYDARMNSLGLESPRPTAQPPWNAMRYSEPLPSPPDDAISRGLPYHRPSVTNLKGGLDTESRTSSEAQLRIG